MQGILRKMQEKRANGDSGFTLVELLVVVVIIGVLVAIAIPLYLNFRKGAANKSAASDVRGAISAIEQYYTDNANAYPASSTSGLGANLVFASASGSPQTATVSPGNTIGYQNNTTSYTVCGVNNDGGTIYVYNSLNGGAAKKSSQTTLAACVSNGN